MTATTASLSQDQATCAPIRRSYARLPGPDEAKRVDEITAMSDVAHGDDAPCAKAAETAAVEFAAKAKGLEALRTAVVDAASVGAGVWFSYLFVLLYLAIAVGSVTHRDLLFENPVKLPFLNADLPVTVFFVVGPGLFLIVHAYVLLHLVPLAEHVVAFRAELQTRIVEEDMRAPPLRQLPSNIFVQFLAGPNQAWAVRSLRWVVVQASLVFLPLALLVLYRLPVISICGRVIRQAYHVWGVDDAGILLSQRTGGGRAAALGTTRERAGLPAGSDDREHARGDGA